jgi:thiamine biosynthesis lipoprotein
MPLFHFGFSAMASVNELQIWADAETDARRGADAAIADMLRIEAKYSRYRDDSVVTRINREAGRAEIPIDAETAALLRYADQCYRLSGALFDITSGALRRAWDFRRTPPRLPTGAEL